MEQFTIKILNKATTMDMVLRYYSAQKTLTYFNNKKLVLLDGHLGEAGQFHGPIWALVDEDNKCLTVTRELTDLLSLKEI
jgi:hypothetical protein